MTPNTPQTTNKSLAKSCKCNDQTVFKNITVRTCVSEKQQIYDGVFVFFQLNTVTIHNA